MQIDTKIYWIQKKCKQTAFFRQGKFTYEASAILETTEVTKGKHPLTGCGLTCAGAQEMKNAWWDAKADEIQSFADIQLP